MRHSSKRKMGAGSLLSSSASTVVFADMVQSVRLIEAAEHDVISRWIDLSEATKSKILPQFDGSFVKSYGDGFLLSFETARDAVRATMAIREENESNQANLSPTQYKFELKFGISTCSVIIGPDDIYGHGVNLAKRLTSLAKPNEILISQETRDHLTDRIDAEICDMGECWVRNISESIRAFSVAPSGKVRASCSPLNVPDGKPAIAILPLQPRIADPRYRIIGDVFAEELIRTLTRSSLTSVISRLSSTAMALRGLTVSEIGNALGAAYVVTGTFDVDGKNLRINPELSETSGETTIWSESIACRTSDILNKNDNVITQLASDIFVGITSHEIRQARLQPLPSLRAYTLLIGAVSLLHRFSRNDFEFARELLEELTNRSTQHARAQAWLAFWHAINVHQGWSDNRQRDTALATDAISRALDTDPDCGLTLAIDGSVKANLHQRLDLAEESYNAAIDKCPSEALAWILRAALYAFSDRGEKAVENALHAIRLSPFDPHRFLFDTVAASAYLTAGRDAEALSFADRSLKANRLHSSALRVKTVATWRLGLTDEARETLTELTKLEPGLTVSNYVARSANSRSRIGQQIAQTFREIGVPE